MPPADQIDGSTGDFSTGDFSADHFSAGCTDAGAYVARTLAGEIILTPKVAGEFTGDVLPEGWTVTPRVEGGTGRLEDGMLSLDGASVGCDPVMLSPRSLEFSAVFAPRPDQHAGLGTNFVDVPWVMFSTKWGRRLYGRTHLLTIDDKKLSAEWFDAPHHFRIDWNILDIIFSVDDVRVAHLMVPIPGYMRALAANERLGGQPLRIEWMRLSPYTPSGRFTSRVFDAGTVADWHVAAWEADVPEGTSLAMYVRTGDVARPGRSWTPWRRLRRSGDVVGATTRYLQYRAELATTHPSWTPVLRKMRLSYSVTGPGPETSGDGPRPGEGTGPGTRPGEEAGRAGSSSSFVSGRRLGCQ